MDSLKRPKRRSNSKKHEPRARRPHKGILVQFDGSVEAWFNNRLRLIAELRFYQIKTIEEANRFLKEDFIPRFNGQFSVPAREKECKFRQVDPQNLDLIFCKKVSRKFSQAESFSYAGETYVLQDEQKYKFRTVHINTHLDGSQSFDIIGRPVKAIKATENDFKESNIRQIKVA